MIELFKITAVFVFVVALINRKVNVGIALLAASLLMGLLFGMGILAILVTTEKAVVDATTLKLTGIIVLMMFMGNIMRHLENLKRIIGSLEGLVSDLRIVSASIPAFIGLMPMPGGAMLSAPFVKELGEKLKLTAEQNTLVNYWFRHVWEYCLPIYPAVILVPTLVGMPIREFSLMMVPFTLFSIILGVIFILSKMKPVRGKKGKTTDAVKRLLLDVWPVLFVIVAYILLGVDLLLSLLIVIVLLLLTSRMNVSQTWKVFMESKAFQMGFLALCVMIFQFIITESGAVESLSETFKQLGIPLPVIVFTIPYVSGLLTGLTIGAVGISFPIIMFALVDGGLNTGYIMLAYVGGYLGILSSPVHLCLILSKDYFGADLGKIYRMLLPLFTLMILMAVLLLFL